MGIAQIFGMSIVVCFACWGIVNLFIPDPSRTQEKAASSCACAGFILLALLCIVWYSSGVYQQAKDQLTQQGFEVIHLEFGRDSKPGQATVKYHGCIGTFDFIETNGLYQVGIATSSGFTELTNVEHPKWTSCPPKVTPS